jgi:hypothetical protein
MKLTGSDVPMLTVASAAVRSARGSTAAGLGSSNLSSTPNRSLGLEHLAKKQPLGPGGRS